MADVYALAGVALLTAYSTSSVLPWRYWTPVPALPTIEDVVGGALQASTAVASMA